MELMFSVNDNYALPAKVMLASFCHSNQFEHHNIYLFHNENISDSAISDIKLFLENKFDVSFVEVPIVSDLIKDLPLKGHFSIETYFRFFAQSLLPQDIDRVIWLDADMIVKKSLRDFYYQDFNNKHIIVCEEANGNAKSIIEKMQLPADTVYFNAGIIVFNLSLIRKTIDENIYFDYIKNNREKITWLDQDVLNAVYYDKKKVCDYRVYNYHFNPRKKFSSDELDFIEKNTCVLHYVTPLKPWTLLFTNPLKKYYNYYQSMALTNSQRAKLAVKSTKDLLKIYAKMFLKH